MAKLRKIAFGITFFCFLFVGFSWINEKYESNGIPNDATSQALRSLLNDGADFTKPHDIDFHVAVPSKAAGNSVGEAASKAGYSTELVHDEDGSWTLWCTKSMLPSHDGITLVEKELAGISKPFGGYPDGWGTFTVK